MACHSDAGLGGVRGPAVEAMVEDYLTDPSCLEAQILSVARAWDIRQCRLRQILDHSQRADSLHSSKLLLMPTRGVTPLGQ